MANSAHVASAESAAAVSLSPTVSQVRLPSHAANKALARLDNTDAWLEVAQQLGLSSQELNVALHILAAKPRSRYGENVLPTYLSQAVRI